MADKMIPVEHLTPGMMVDLEADPYADPNHNNTLFQNLLVEVSFSRQETPNCVLVGFESWDWCGFPNGHRVKVSS